MGPSGAGKTTLLNVICQRNSADYEIAGEGVRFNGVSAERLELHRLVAFVQQEDTMMEFLTVSELLNFAGSLRLPYLSEPERERLLRRLLINVGLWHARHSQIGGTIHKGLSGGERKRLHILVELLSNPAVMCLDEPTSGLDSETAFSLISYLIKQCRMHGRTVITTLHSPSSEIFHALDRLCLLRAGRAVFDGNAAAAVEFFGRAGMWCPSDWNPPEFFLKLISEKDNENDTSEQLEIYSALEFCENQTYTGNSSSQGKPMSYTFSQNETSLGSFLVRDSTRRSSKQCCPSLGLFFQQYLALCWIETLDNFRNSRLIKSRVISAGVNSMILILCYVPLGTDQRSVLNRVGLLYGSAYALTYYAATNCVIVVSAEQGRIRRDIHSGLYSTMAYFAAKLTEISLIGWFFVLTYISMWHWGLGLSLSGEAFLKNIVTAFSVYQAFTAIGLLCSALCPSMLSGVLFSESILQLSLLTGGLLKNLSLVQDYLIWICYANPVRYAWECLMQTEFANRQLDWPVNNQVLLDNYQLDLGFGKSLGILWTCTVAYTLAAAGVLYYRIRKLR